MTSVIFGGCIFLILKCSKIGYIYWYIILEQDCYWGLLP
jgi:hypothetical protein